MTWWAYYAQSSFIKYNIEKWLALYADIADYTLQDVLVMWIQFDENLIN